MNRCCCCKNTEGEKDPKLFKPRSERKCTDCLFCILFAVFWVGMVVIAGLAVQGGNPERLLYGVDHNGNVCSGDTSEIYYPRITEDIKNFIKAGNTNPLDIELFGICMSSCPGIGEVVCTGVGRTAMDAIKTAHSLTDLGVMAKTQEVSAYASIGANLKVVKANCWTVPMQTTSYFYRCLWQRNSTTTTTVTCQEPARLRGVVIDSSTDEATRSSCVTTRVETNTVALKAGQDDPLLDQMFDTVETMGRYVSDISKATPVVLVCGGLLAVIMGFMWLLIIQRCGGCMVWTTIWLVVAVLFAATLYAYDQAGLLDIAVNAATTSVNDAAGTTFSTSEPQEVSDADATLQERWKWFAIILTVVLVVVLLLIVFMRRRIRVAIAMIKEAAKAVRSMPSLMLFPFFSVVCTVLLVVYWLIIAGYIYSNGDVDKSSVSLTESEVASDSSSGIQNLLCAKDASGNVDTSTCVGLEAAYAFQAASANDYLLLYHFFGLLWTSNFITGFFIMSIAGAVCSFYFGVRDKAEDRPRFAVWDAVKTTLLKHLGSIAFGAMIIALVQLVRAILAYIDRKSQDVQKKNVVIRYVFKCLACCLWCFEKCVRYISINAYVIVAMKGKSFCGAAVEAVVTILKNIGQVGVVNTITAFLFVLGKILVTTSCAICAFLWLDNASNYKSGGSDELYSYWAPMLITLLMAYAIATAFMNVLGIAIDTIVLCVCVDTQRSGAGSKEKPYYASKGLLKAMGLAGGESYAAGFIQVTPASGSNEEEAKKDAGKGVEML